MPSGGGYIADRSGHSRGSTVDLTLVYLPWESEVPMGTGFDFFSTRSWPTDAEQPFAVRANRLLLSIVMQRHGFKPYSREWWHFRLADEPYPETYFDFPVRWTISVRGCHPCIESTPTEKRAPVVAVARPGE